MTDHSADYYARAFRQELREKIALKEENRKLKSRLRVARIFEESQNDSIALLEHKVDNLKDTLFELSEHIHELTERDGGQPDLPNSRRGLRTRGGGSRNGSRVHVHRLHARASPSFSISPIRNQRRRERGRRQGRRHSPDADGAIDDNPSDDVSDDVSDDGSDNDDDDDDQPTNRGRSGRRRPIIESADSGSSIHRSVDAGSNERRSSDAGDDAGRSANPVTDDQRIAGAASVSSIDAGNDSSRRGAARATGSSNAGTGYGEIRGTSRRRDTQPPAYSTIAGRSDSGNDRQQSGDIQ